MDQPKFALDQQVKFSGDHDVLTGKVLNIKWDSTEGYTYEISSKYYDTEQHDMVEGVKICKEEELEDMTGYTGSTTPPIPDQTVNLTDQVNAAPTNTDPAATDGNVDPTTETTTETTPTDQTSTDPNNTDPTQ